MKKIPIEYSAIPGHSRLFNEFLHAEGDVLRFFGSRGPFACRNLGARAARISGGRFPRAELSGMLTDFNRRLGNSELAMEQAASLAEPGVLAIVTGQQPGLFGGPALTVYKALTAVALAWRARREGIPAVPLFWVASEDHDFEEIRQTTLFDAKRELTDAALPPSDVVPLTAAQRRVGDLRLLMTRLQDAFRGTAHGAAVNEWIRASYVPEATLAYAFASLLVGLLGRFGLVMLDASDPQLRRLSSRFYLQAIEDADAIGGMLKKRGSELRAAGFHEQVHWEDDYTLLFHVDETGRRAIRKRDGGFAAGERKWTRRELTAAIEREPVQFSPSALLRPLIQESVLPTLVYAGGPAEVAYFAQVKAIEPLFGCEAAIHPRMSFLLMDARARRYLDRAGLQVTDLFCPLQALREKMAGVSLQPSVLSEWERQSAAAEQSLEGLRALANGVDPSLASAVQTSGRKIAYQIGNLRRKMIRVAAEKDRLLGRRAEYLHTLAYPGDVFQERKINFLSFYARYGPALLDSLASFSPCDTHSHAVFLE